MNSCWIQGPAQGPGSDLHVPDRSQFSAFRLDSGVKGQRGSQEPYTEEFTLQASVHTCSLPLSGAHVCLYSDGTKVTEEFFLTLPDHTELVLLSREQTWSGVVCDIGQLLNTDRHADGIIEAAQGLLSDEQSPKRRKILCDLLLNLDDRSELESREEDEEWFRGVDARFKTKSAYMKYNCESRIRGYMKEVDDASKTIQKAKVRTEFLKTSKYLAETLKTAKYNGCYFDRTEKEPDRLCTQQGWFTCQGSFDQDVCKSLHSINPYGSRESRIVFSTWNLDHRLSHKAFRCQTFLLIAQLKPHDREEEDGDSRSAGSSTKSQDGRRQPELLLLSAVHQGEPEAGSHRVPQERSSQPAV
ncbi:DNA fragmentation factor subunit beta isoform X2 [Trachinotus anak]|uniref:DNA fragmentation factor subunit beta isoform X2 n=1 Tax=Trachinotus anak TaxID=443729 RepID=UPI0039F1C457